MNFADDQRVQDALRERYVRVREQLAQDGWLSRRPLRAHLTEEVMYLYKFPPINVQKQSRVPPSATTGARIPIGTSIDSQVDIDMPDEEREMEDVESASAVEFWGHLDRIQSSHNGSLVATTGATRRAHAPIHFIGDGTQIATQQTRRHNKHLGDTQVNEPFGAHPDGLTRANVGEYTAQTGVYGRLYNLRDSVWRRFLEADAVDSSAAIKRRFKSLNRLARNAHSDI